MTPHDRAYDCAWSLLTEYAHRLTLAQNIAARIALIAGPDAAPLGMIAIAAQIIGERI